MRAHNFTVKWAMRLYPPLFLNFIWLKDLDLIKGYAKVKIAFTVFNRNYNGSMFGGIIPLAADPFLPLLVYYNLRAKGLKVKVWSQESNCRFIKPITRCVYFNIKIDEDLMSAAIDKLYTEGRAQLCHNIIITDKDDKVYASVTSQVFIQLLLK